MSSQIADFKINFEYVSLFTPPPLEQINEIQILSTHEIIHFKVPRAQKSGLKNSIVCIWLSLCGPKRRLKPTGLFWFKYVENLNLAQGAEKLIL